MLVAAGVLVGAAALILAVVALFRTLFTIGISIAVILLLIAAAFYFFPDVAGPLSREVVGILDYLFDALSWALEAVR